MLRRVFILAVLALLFSPPGLAQPNQPREAIASARGEWTSHLHQKKLDDFMKLYAPDAVFITGSGKRIIGQQAIRDLTRKAMDAFTSDIQLRSLNTEFSGELAYDSGNYRETVTATADGRKTPVEGDYLTIYRRNSNQSWLIVQQVWTEVSTPSHSPADAEVLSEVTKYYSDMTCRGDRMSPAFAEHFWSGATITTVWQPPGESKPVVAVIPINEFAAQATQGPCSKPIFEEKMDGAEVKIERGLAQVWARYQARFGKPGDVKEWSGVDAFTLVKHEGRWKIASLVFRPEGGGPR